MEKSNFREMEFDIVVRNMEILKFYVTLKYSLELSWGSTLLLVSDLNRRMFPERSRRMVYKLISKKSCLKLCRMEYFNKTVYRK